MEQEERVFSWQAPEYSFRKKSVDWYWWFAIIIIGLVAFAVYFENILFAFVIVIGAFSIILYSVKQPRMIEYQATDRGIKIEKKLYPYQALDHFWIKDHGDDTEKILLLQSQKTFMPLLVIHLGNADVDELRHFLLHSMEEQEIHEPIGQQIMDWLGF